MYTVRLTAIIIIATVFFYSGQAYNKQIHRLPFPLFRLDIGKKTYIQRSLYRILTFCAIVRTGGRADGFIQLHRRLKNGNNKFPCVLPMYGHFVVEFMKGNNRPRCASVAQQPSLDFHTL